MMPEKLRDLKLKKAKLFADIESLSEVAEQTFTQFGKLEAEIMKLEKQIIREIKNIFNDED